MQFRNTVSILIIYQLLYQFQTWTTSDAWLLDHLFDLILCVGATRSSLTSLVLETAAIQKCIYFQLQVFQNMPLAVSYAVETLLCFTWVDLVSSEVDQKMKGCLFSETTQNWYNDFVFCLNYSKTITGILRTWMLIQEIKPSTLNEA